MSNSDSGKRLLTRIVFAVLGALMLLFMAVQYNDPDGVIWMVVYAVPAIWCALAVLAQQHLASRRVSSLLLLCIVAATAGIVALWPEVPQFWTKNVWYHVEEARESLGLMIVTAVLGSVYFFARKQA